MNHTGWSNRYCFSVMHQAVLNLLILKAFDDTSGIRLLQTGKEYFIVRLSRPTGDEDHHSHTTGYQKRQSNLLC